jgi:hypothetical protein
MENERFSDILPGQECSCFGCYSCSKILFTAASVLMAHFRTGRERAGTLVGTDEISTGTLAGSVIWSG